MGTYTETYIQALCKRDFGTFNHKWDVSLTFFTSECKEHQELGGSKSVRARMIEDMKKTRCLKSTEKSLHEFTETRALCTAITRI